MRKGFHRKQAWKPVLSLFLSILNRQERPLCVLDVLPLFGKSLFRRYIDYLEAAVEEKFVLRPAHRFS